MSPDRDWEALTHGPRDQSLFIRSGVMATVLATVPTRRHCGRIDWKSGWYWIAKTGMEFCFLQRGAKTGSEQYSRLMMVKIKKMLVLVLVMELEICCKKVGTGFEVLYERDGTVLSASNWGDGIERGKRINRREEGWAPGQIRRDEISCFSIYYVYCAYLGIVWADASTYPTEKGRSEQMSRRVDVRHSAGSHHITS